MSSSADGAVIRVGLTLALAIGLTLTISLPAAACDSQAGAIDQGVTGSVDCDPSSDPSDPSDPSTPVSGDGPECTEERRSDPAQWSLHFDVDWSEADAQIEVGLITADREEGQVIAVRRDCDGNDRSAPFWTDPPPEGTSEDFDAVLAARDRALANLDLQPPDVDIAPPNGGVLVGLPAWLWIDQEWSELTDQDQTPGGITVEVYAEPSELTWTTPEGDRVCDGPGIPWTQAAWDTYEATSPDVRGHGNPACTFVFVHASGDDPYDTSVTVSWTTGWSFNDGPRQELPPLQLTSVVPLDVGEVRAVRTR